MLRLIAILFFQLIFVLATSCDDNSGGMNSCVDCYQNVFTCKINGVDWSPYCIPDRLFGSNSINTQYYNEPPFFEILATNVKLSNGFHLISRTTFKSSDSI